MLDCTRTCEAQLDLPAPSPSLQGQVPWSSKPQANRKAGKACRDVDRVVGVSALHSMLRCALNAESSSIFLSLEVSQRHVKIHACKTRKICKR